MVVLKHLIPCKVHPEGRIKINLVNGFYCTLCQNTVNDYEVFRTIVYVGFAVNHVINSGIGIQNVRMNGWKKTDEYMDKVLELV